MIYTNLYISSKLTHSSERRHKQAGVFLLSVGEKQEDISEEIRGDYYGTGEYMTPEQLPLCLHKDWKPLHEWECDPDDVSMQEIVAEFDKGFDKPEILAHISQSVSAYTRYLFGNDVQLGSAQSKLRQIYCLNREEYDALNWGYFVGDQDMSKTNNDKFVNALIIGKVDKMINYLLCHNCQVK